jgi:hypothetical protein
MSVAMIETTAHSDVVTPLPSHPTPCPSWCKDRRRPAEHSFGPTHTAHWSRQYQMENPSLLPGDERVMLRAELVRIDEGHAVAEQALYVAGATDVELSADEADIFIAQAQAFVDTLRVLRRQMG